MILVFSGYNQRAVIAVIRTLESYRLDYGIIASDINDTIFRTRYRTKVKYTRRSTALNKNVFKDILAQIETKESMLIAPTTEYINRFVLKNRRFLEENNCIVPLVDYELYKKISDKESFATLCEQYGIATPPLCNCLDGFMEPVVAKPQKYVASDGKIYAPMFLLNKNEWEHFKNNYPIDDFVFQKYLDGGESFYLFFYFTRNGKVYTYSQKNIAQQPNGKSILLAVSSDYHMKKRLIGPYIRMFEEVGFRGIVMVEVRRKNGIDYMIEANPRLWGPLQLCCDAGYNFFEVLLTEYEMLHEKIKWGGTKKKTGYYWSGGVKGEITNSDDIFWHEGCKEEYDSNSDFYNCSDIFNREDTLELYKIERLKNLYLVGSKHSNYQILPDKLSEMVSANDLSIKSRYEKQRMDYILSKISLNKMNVLDIGCNTGFFTFTALSYGALNVRCYEGNRIHAEFVDMAAELLGMSAKIEVIPEYYLFCNGEAKYDIVFNLNVMHHIGDDYGDANDIRMAKNKMIEELNSLAVCCRYMIFQMGFNWKGNRNACLFDHGMKREVISFIKEGCCDTWDILAIGVAIEKNKCGIEYVDINEINIERNDSLGEFLNRPLFIMRSRLYGCSIMGD